MRGRALDSLPAAQTQARLSQAEAEVGAVIHQSIEGITSVVVWLTSVIEMLNELRQALVDLPGLECEKLLKGESGVNEKTAEVFVVGAKGGWGECEVQ